MKKDIEKDNTKKLSDKRKSLYNIVFILSFLFIFLFYDLFLRLSIGNLNTSEDLINILAFKYDLLFIIIFFIIFNLLVQFISKRIAKFYLLLIYIVFFIVFIVNYIILKLKEAPLSFGLLFFTDEGFSFFNYIADAINFSLLVFFIVITIMIIVSYKLSNNYIDSHKLNKKETIIYYSVLSVITLVLFVSIRFNLYGQTASFSTPRKFYYDNLNDSIDSYVVLGLYEYMYRDVVLTNREKYVKYDDKEINNYLKSLDRKKEKNDKTGIFKDKNLIMIMLESMDNYVMNERVSPNLVNIRNTKWNFNNRYNYLPNGGATIYTEYSSINGLYYNTNPSKIYVDLYPQSIPAVFGKNGYRTISMHQNTGEYYSRTTLHKNEYFQDSYFLLDIDPDVDYASDLVMVDNDKYYDWIVPKDGNKFMSYIITFSAHGPYNDSNCSGLSEKDCFESLASVTDKFIGRLIDRLKEDNLLDDTVIVLYTDHQAYCYNFPKSYLKTLKTIDKEKNIKAIPFMIYSTDIEHEDYDMLVNDIDFPPTIFNLFGIDYDPNYYLGTDIFSNNHRNLIMFNNNLWYDGKVYGSSLDYDKYEYTYDTFETSNMMINNDYYNMMSKKKNKS